jgi:hypothetical protein
MIPFIINCNSNSDCFGDLTCEGTPPKAVCTRRCTSTADCTNDPALGTTFTCAANNVCVPKLPAGAPGTSDACLSGQALGGKCVSPTGWACTADAQCANGQCDIIPLSNPQFGRCK